MKKNKLVSHPTSPFARLIKANPDAPMSEIRRQYREYLKQFSLVDTTTVNDLVGWVAHRMTTAHTLDAIIIVYGDRGVGKSYVCGYIGEQVDKRLCLLDGEPLKSHFSVDNVRSVDPQGTLELLSPEQLKQRKNQVFILDDASITSNARSFQSQQNQYINYVLTTARIYRHCIIVNTIASNLLDSVVRSFADIGVLVMGVVPGTTLNKCKVYRMSNSNHMGFGNKKRDSIGKYFQLRVDGERTRITTFYANKPSDEWCDAYDIVRKENTDNLGDVMAERFKTVEVAHIDGTPKRKVTSREQKWQETLDKHYDEVVNYYSGKTTGKKETPNAIERYTGVPRNTINRLLGEYATRSAPKNDTTE